MARQYTSLVALLFDKTGVHAFQASDSAIRCGYYDKCVKLSTHHTPTILELFAHYNHIDQVYAAYNSLQHSGLAVDSRVLSILDKVIGPEYEQVAMLLINNKVYICPPAALPIAYNMGITRQSESKMSFLVNRAYKKVMNSNKVVELTEISHADAKIASTLQFRYCGIDVKWQEIVPKHYENTVSLLYTQGLLTVPVGAIEFGNLRRLSPICHDYGFSRGTPIDRYYLNQFIKEICNCVVGNTLEIGGKKQNCSTYGFINATTYRAIDMQQQPGVDIVGDIHNSESVEHNSLDSIIIFNVLEHCKQPWVVVENMYKWLKEGGKVFCMVPNAQRIHNDPQDYWRILPDGMESLFAIFPIRKMFVYGNPITVTAAIMGVAAEELSEEELNFYNNEYPVATCMYAVK